MADGRGRAPIGKALIAARRAAVGKLPAAQRAAQIAKDVVTARLTREAYNAGMNVSRYLETLDPTSAHTGTLARTDAFNRVLAQCGIRTRSVPEMGMSASTVEDMVQHPVARHLLIECISRAYRSVALGKQRAPIVSTFPAAGSAFNQYEYPAPRDTMLQAAIPLAELVGQTTGIRSNYYRPFYLEDVSNANSRVSEAAEVPAVKISTSEKTITLRKYGRRLDITYETVRHMPIDLFGFYVQRIAIAVEADKVAKVMDVIVNGDGTSGSAATNYNLTTLDPATAAGTLTLRAWLAFKMKFKNPLQLTHILAQDMPALDLMLLPVGSANLPAYLANQVVTGQGLTPINQTLAGGERIGWLDDAPANKLVGIDRRLAVERVFEIGANIQEQDTDIVNQINQLVLTEVEGYAIIDPKASKILTLNA